MNAEPIIRRADGHDRAALLALARALALEGDTYVFSETIADAELLAYWFPRPGATFVAEREGRILGCFLIRPNHMGRGAHVANASYLVAAEARGQGLGRAMAERSLDEARAMGFTAMQFNLVVSTNPARRLWERLGFAVVGRLPKAFDHKELGLVDALVMHRFL